MNSFDTAVLNGVVDRLIMPQAALLGRYFPRESVSTKEQIAVDVIKGARRIAPFVSPYVEGKIVQSHGYSTNLFAPAYVKPKFRFTPDRPLKRNAGEALMGTLTPEQRLQALIMQDLEDGLHMITRREEVMASEAIRLAQITVAGDNYPTQVVNFQRDAALTSLTPTEYWDDDSAVPLDDLNDWSLLILKIVGAKANDVIFGIEAWKAFSKNPLVEKRLLQLNVSGTSLAPKPVSEEGLTFMGVIDGFNLWVYAGWYVDPPEDVSKEIWPGHQVALCSNALQGVRNYGAIMDLQALRPQRAFAKSWEEQDPSVRFLMLQSAPLPVTERPDAAACVDVLAPAS